MATKPTIKFIHFDRQKQRIRVVEFSIGKLLLIMASSILVLVLFANLVSALVVRHKENSRLAQLQAENKVLAKELQKMHSTEQAIQTRIEEIKHYDEQLRTYADLPKIDEDIWHVGTGGHVGQPAPAMPSSASEMSQASLKIEARLDKFYEQLGLAVESFHQVYAKIESDYAIRTHTPSIRPVPDGVITSRFGIRVDPFTLKKKAHHGIDFFANPGTSVLAPADGVVEVARSYYKPSDSFGKVIIINHGNGLKTRYGHLSKIYVKRGQKVHRFDVIGEVGSTGRSTGPHLHYEVIRNDHFQDPMAYIFD